MYDSIVYAVLLKEFRGGDVAAVNRIMETIIKEHETQQLERRVFRRLDAIKRDAADYHDAR